MTPAFVLFIAVCSLLKVTADEGCHKVMSDRCTCGKADYFGVQQYLVNCTNSGFNDTIPLQYLPPSTEVLIFRGNNIQKLPWNVFGNLQNYSQLHVVDMSNNQIHEILGKSYHRVSNVKRLILNHNHISIADDEHHPRIFSNFANLEELHLTDAFEDNAENLGIDLHDVFVNSNLTKLLKLHLEQNEVTKFRDREVFCNLPNLMDLHLGDNRLTGIDFRIDCLKHLRFVDLEGNKIQRLLTEEFEELDALPARNQSLQIDLTENPFSCECGIHKLYDWLSTTKVSVKDSDRLRCIRRDGDLPPAHPEHVDCTEPKKPHIVTAEPPVTKLTAFIVIAIITIVLPLTMAFLYNKRNNLRARLSPLVNTVSRKVYYSSIRHNDDQEVEV